MTLMLGDQSRVDGGEGRIQAETAERGSQGVQAAETPESASDQSPSVSLCSIQQHKCTCCTRNGKESSMLEIPEWPWQGM